MFNEFQQRLASLGFQCPLTAKQFDLLLAAGYGEVEIEQIAGDMMDGFSLEEAVDVL